MPYIDRDSGGKVTGIFACQQYEGQEYAADTSPEMLGFGLPSAQDEANDEARAFLLSTDWLVIRHRDQLALGIETSLTGEEFLALLENRQHARNSVVEV